MAYHILSQDEQDEMIAQTLHAQERDHCSHTMNLVRYESILAQSGLSEDWRKHVSDLRDETRKRLAEVDSIITALEPQVPPKARMDKAMARITARNEMRLLRQ